MSTKMNENKRKSGSITNEQKDVLVEFMENHCDLKNGKFSKDFTFKTAQVLWEEVTITLNAIPGVKKDWRQWRKTWHDLRTNAKAKKSKILKHQRATGGGRPIDDILTPVEDRIVDLIGVTAIEGHADIRESATIFEYEEIMQTDSLDATDSSTVPFVSVPPSPTTLPESVPTTSTALSTPTPVRKTTQSKARRQRQGVQRLEKTIAATSRLADATDKKLKIKEEYYNSKLELYKRCVIATERIAVAMEKLAEKNIVL